MHTGWLAPKDIAENWGLNSRRLNESHVESPTAHAGAVRITQNFVARFQLEPC